MSKLVEIGAFWKKEKTNEDGTKKSYLSGTLTLDGVAYPVVVFKNEKKEKDSQPDFRMMRRVEDTPEEAEIVMDL